MVSGGRSKMFLPMTDRFDLKSRPEVESVTIFIIIKKREI